MKRILLIVTCAIGLIFATYLQIRPLPWQSKDRTQDRVRNMRETTREKFTAVKPDEIDLPDASQDTALSQDQPAGAQAQLLPAGNPEVVMRTIESVTHT